MGDPSGSIVANPLSAELIVVGALKSLVANGDGTHRCFPDVAPQLTARPYITYIAAGGQSTNYLDDTVALQNSRIQVSVWADDRASAGRLMQSVIGALTGEPINATSIGAPVGVYESDTKLRGSRLDFSIWFTP
ncbi:DUF3168 domain-containing protein [Burkholderia vietnamiensis]|uniref:DUF3168 domain-containing protein n=1 Tax=Burkholderia vietnamiensis TaxID=60552 RepID=A0ABS1ATS5_BURVI|nr:DUF3168 domain-containing protein [Burkholderia vietnamiensis]MBJ9687516.1 DUF3168 domain-containing protein [Burkholderia vietnamiensis]